MQVMTTNRRYSRGQQPRLGDVKTYWQRLCSCYPHDPHSSCCLAHVLCSYVLHVFCLYSTHTYIYVLPYVRPMFDFCFPSVSLMFWLRFIHVLFLFISPMFFLMFYLCFTNAILMSHICFAYVSRLFYLCCTYVFTFASWPVGLRYWLPMIGPMLYMSQFVQESIYSENGFGTAGTARFGRWSLVVHPIFEAITLNWTQLANCFTVGLLHRHGLCVHCTGLWILPLVGVRSPLG
jgi:hypothetical protein